MLQFFFKRITRDSSGATLVESIPSVLITVIITLFLFDLARVLVVQGLLSYGAYSGLEKATKIPDLQLDGRPCAQFPNTPVCQNSIQTANANLLTYVTDYIKSEAVSVPSRTLLGAENGQSSMRLISSQSAVIRPGSAASPGGIQCQTPPDYDGYGALMRDCPILVDLVATVKPLIPFLPRITLHGRAYGYREAALSGAYPIVPINIGSPPVGGPTGTPCATPLPGSICSDPARTPEMHCEWNAVTCSCHCGDGE